jgi:hypothetical protein
MNARTCQLCGKPLSRLRVGGDGDFCSREHRNQHRLRAGMDRLEEANKVTSLMRRRENPRHISAARLMCNSALERRGFFEPKLPAPRYEMTAFSPVLPGPAAPRVASGADRCVSPQTSRPPKTTVSRGADASRILINGRGTVPLVPPRRQKLLVKISQAPMVSLRRDAPAASAGPRVFGMLRQGQMRVHLGDAALVPGVFESRRAPALLYQTQLRGIRSSAVEGNALRVSIGIGFRVPTVKWRDSFNRPPAQAALVWPRTPRAVAPESQDFEAACRNLEIGIPRWPTCLPTIADGTRPAQFVFPETLPPRNRRPADCAQPTKRSTDIAWKPSEPRSRGIAVLPPSAGFAKRNGAHLFTLAMTPSSTRPVRQVAFTAFIPQDPVGCPKVIFEGTVATAIAGPQTSTGVAAEIASPQTTLHAVPPPKVRIEEHFGSGWDNWVGGMKEWKVDVAGVRTGALALFVPTLELIDYDLDFLARIDTRSLNWVVRAAGLDEYLQCKLTAVDGGELEFSRCAVVGGVAQEPVVAAERLPGKPRAAMTVTTEISGDTFTVSVDGNSIETWNDPRFPMGGVGFIGAPDDRARLYWVRLSSTELTAKEHQNK